MLVDVGDGGLDDLSRAGVQFAKDQWIGEGRGEALVVDLRAVNSKGCSTFIFIVEDCIWEELFEANDVLVSDMILD